MKHEESIKIVKTMIAGNQFDRLLKFRLFDEHDKVAANPPDSASPYIPPVDSNNSDSNANIWRSRGAEWNEPGETNAIINFGAQCRLFEIWVFDGQAYAPVTFQHSGTNDKPYEVCGGTLEIYGNVIGNQATRDLLGTVEITNAGAWKKVELNADGESFTTASLEFRKVQDTVNNIYSWSGPWTSLPGAYVCDVCVPEIYIRGIPLGELTPDEQDDDVIWSPTPAGRPAVRHGFTLREFIGTNSFALSYLPHHEPFGNVREYHNWVWTEFTAGDDAGNNNAMTQTDGEIAMFTERWGGVFDNYYRDMKELGVEVSICIQGGIRDAPRKIPNFQANQEFEDAHSYLAHAQSMFQHAARYGSNTEIDPSLVRAAPGTEKKIGLGLIKYYENWNEPNAYWETMGVNQFSGATFAAMTSADYDGHMNSMGLDAGIKNADPDAKLVMGGLVGFPTEENFSNMSDATLRFLYDMMKWFDKNRSEQEWLKYNGSLDGYVKYPFDVMNGHYYSPDSGRCPDGNIAKTGISPESDLVYEKMKSFTEFSRKYFPEAEVWLSEFGWETSNMMTSRFSAAHEFESDGEIQNKGINSGFDQYDVQANWLLREYLLLAAAGIDRAQQYMLYNAGYKDDDPDGGGMHQSDGFVDAGVNGGVNKDPLDTAEKKPSWYYANAFAYWLGDFRFNREIKYGGRGLSKNHADNLTVFEFKKANGDLAYALWLNSSFGAAAKADYTLEAGAFKYARLVKMSREDKHGVTALLNIANSKVTVGAGESPIFVIFSNEA